jgi:multidrug efflux pump subunit AcrB
VAVVAAVFGLATIVAGGRVLTGWSDPGYVVYRPLLIYNTAMGAAYLAAGVVIWRSLHWGKHAAATIFVLNLVVLGAIVFLYAAGGSVAIDSLRAMTFRTAVWLALFVGVVWMSRP